MTTTRLVILGLPRHDPTEDPRFAHLDANNEQQVSYVGSMIEVVNDFDNRNHELLALLGGGAVIFIGADSAVGADDEHIIKELAETFRGQIIDEALEILHGQAGQAAADAEAFQSIYFDAEPRVHLFFDQGDDGLVFHEWNRASRSHTVKWYPDGVITLDGAIIRRTALMGSGRVFSELLLGRELTPAEVAGFIAHRMAKVGPRDLIGYGRSFGPGPDDHTNAALTTIGRKFRSEAVVGTVLVSLTSVTKAKADHVLEVAHLLRHRYPQEPLFIHQQAKEIYLGHAALECFRGTQLPDGVYELGGKSTKHVRIDCGAYVLHTDNGGYIELPVVIGAFEEGNDGSIYAPRQLLDTVDGWLLEVVGDDKDFSDIRPDVEALYYQTHVMVAEGQRIAPDDTVFMIGDVPHSWQTKANYGIVRKVTQTMTQKMLSLRIEIEAHFVGEVKVRSLGKGLACPAEAAGITIAVDGDPTPRMLISAPGIIKDSRATYENLRDLQPCVARVTSRFCRSNYDLYKEKHSPVQVAPGVHRQTYQEGRVSLVFNDRDCTVMTIDKMAYTAIGRLTIEASPVAQSVGHSSMTLPQLAWLSRLPSGQHWLNRAALPGIRARVRSLSYFHKVASLKARATLKKAEVTL